MIENFIISISFSEVEEAYVGNYFRLSEMSGEFLIIQKPDNTFYFLCSNDCDIVGICQSFDWYIVSKDAFNDRLIIGIGLSDKESINGELYRVQDETTLILWCDILRFTFESDFVRQFFPYNTLQRQDAYRWSIVFLYSRLLPDQMQGHIGIRQKDE